MTKQSWKEHSIEGLVIVGSILLAFAIDAGWDRYQQSRLERELLTDLTADLRLNVQAIESNWAMQHYYGFLATYRSLSALYGGDLRDPEMLLEFNLDWRTPSGELEARVREQVFAGSPLLVEPVRVTVWDLIQMLNYPTYGPSIPSLDALVRGSALTEITDVELRAKLLELPPMLADVTDEELALRDTLVATLRDQVIASSPEAPLAGFLYGSNLRGPAGSPAFLIDASLQPSPELAAALTFKLSAHLNILRELDQLRNFLVTLDQLISD